jgi:pimeloyl-ACP methyl ester carboxylesterase
MYPVQIEHDFSRGVARLIRLTTAAVIGAGSQAHAQSTPDSSGFVTAGDGARIYYAIYGNARDTIIVPGAAMLAVPLNSLSTDFTVVFYDPRGRGQSDWIPDAKRLTMADEIRDLESVRAGLGISKAGLIGFSYLGLVTALYTADHPDRVTRLAMLGPTAPDEETASRYAPPEGKARSAAAAARLKATRGAATDTADFAAECRRWYDAYLPVYLGDTTAVTRVSTEFCAQENESPARFQWRVDKTMRSLGRHWDFTKKAKGMRTATLVVQGDKDFAASPDGGRRWAELVPGARLIMLSGAGHLTYVERRDRVLPALARFFSGQWPPEAMLLRTSR